MREDKKEIYLASKVTTNSTSIFCKKEKYKKKNNKRLSVS